MAGRERTGAVEPKRVLNDRRPGQAAFFNLGEDPEHRVRQVDWKNLRFRRSAPALKRPPWAKPYNLVGAGF